MKQIVDQSKIEIAISILQCFVECDIANQIYLVAFMVKISEFGRSGDIWCSKAETGHKHVRWQHKDE